MDNATITKVENGLAYLRIGKDELRVPANIPKGIEAQAGDGALVEKVSGKYMIVAVYG